jgi:aerobic carbon-monoxide dehydrogenase medium subunit
VSAKGTISAAGTGLTNVGPTAIYASAASESLVGKAGSPADFQAAADLAAGAAQPVADNRGPVDFKKDMVRVWTRRTLQRAIARAKGGS